MSLSEITVDGTLNCDGTLELDQKIGLSPGRVTVTVRQETASSPPEDDWWQAMQDARKKMEEGGCHFMDDKEMQEHIEWLRDEVQI